MSGAAMPIVDRAIEAWGTPLPDWVRALAEECQRATQAGAAARIGYSGGAVSQILSNRYPGNLRAVERAIRDALMRATVMCPVLDEISGEACRKQQAQPFRSINPQSIALYRACRAGCPHSRLGEGDPS